MNKIEMKKILTDAILEKEKNMDEYHNVMMKILPEYMVPPQERIKKKYRVNDDMVDAILEFNQNEAIDYNNPDESIMDIIYDFIYKDKSDLTKKERKFLKNFDKILSVISTCKYALGIKEDSGIGITCDEIDKRFFDSNTLHVENEDIIITDPCYLGRNKKNERGYELNHIHHDTIYGDWSCIVINENTKETLGTFCADAGEVGVFKLNDVKKAYPNYNYIESYPHTVTVIKNFTGDVTIKVGFDKKYKYFYCYVEGKGSINFKSYQNGF